MAVDHVAPKGEDDFKLEEIENTSVGSGNGETPETQSGLQSQEDKDYDRKLLLRTDLHVIPILFILFLCAYIDRINIGNARIQGLEEDLNMSGIDYNIALFTFFIPYILLELPANLLLKKLQPSRFLPTLMIGFGIITVCQGLTRSFSGLVVCRVLIGTLEAGFLPGSIYVISMFYKRHELQWRFNLFFSSALVGGAFSGLLAYAIAHMHGIAGYSGWRWIFILEGIATILIAIGAYWACPDWPENANFYTEEEREYWKRRLAADVQDSSMSHWDKGTARRIFGDVKIYLGALMYIGITTGNYSTAFFTPTILKQLGWTSLRAQYMSIPIYMATVVAMLCTAQLSDKLRHRFGFIISGCLVAVIGHAILLNMHSVTVAVRYFAVYLIVIGGNVALPICVVWLNNNLGGHYKRGAGAAIQVGFGNVAGIIASNIFLQKEAPRYTTGFSIAISMACVCVLSAITMLFYMKFENRKRDQGKRDHLLELPEEQRNNLGDDHPTFRFTF